VVRECPLFVWPNKSRKNQRLDVVQQLLNAYFDRTFGVGLGWMYHPLSTQIPSSGLRSDFRKSFGGLSVETEVQFGNAARWYSDVFKMQAAYSDKLVNLGLCILPVASLAARIDSNVASFERAWRELPSAELSITLPILLVGIYPDADTPVVDVSRSQFRRVKDIVGRGNALNRWRIINGYLSGVPIEEIGPSSDPGPMLSMIDSVELEPTETDAEEDA
jgi:hypothetical protein